MSNHEAGCQPMLLQQRRCGGAHSINVLSPSEASQLWYPPPDEDAVGIKLLGYFSKRDGYFSRRDCRTPGRTAGANTRMFLRAIEIEEWVVDGGQRRHVLCAVAPVEARIQGEEAHCNLFTTGSYLACSVKLSHDGVDEAKARKPHRELGHADGIVDSLTRSLKMSYDG